jgi:RAP domain
MQAFSPQDVANTVWSFAVMGLKHTRFLDAVNEALHDRMVNWVGGGRLVKNKFTAQELSNAIYAFASLNYLPDGLLRMSEAYFMDRLGGEVTPEGVSKFLNRKELAILCFTVAVFGEYPPQLVEIIYTGLIGTEDKKDPLFMERLYNDGGLHENSVTSLLYLQSIMDLEAGESAKTFSLPVDFPTKWTSSNRGQSIPDGLMDNGLLELHSSKVQKRISDAFTRIGFSHTEEFVFTMEDISRHHGIRMAPIPFELLSVDIADEKSRICIEVDGPGHFITNIDTQGFVGGRNILSSVGSYRDVKGFKEFEFNWDYQDQEINGSTSLKIRLLRELGWHVVNLAFWEWYPVQGSQDKEEAYCGSLLDKAK